MKQSEIELAERFKDAEKGQVLVVMGSQSDMPIMQHACLVLAKLGVYYYTRIWSAHRTPDRMRAGAKEAQSKHIKGIIAGAGGAAHLPGMIKAYTRKPVFGVPIPLRSQLEDRGSLAGLDSLLSIVQMPQGKPVNTMAIGVPGAINAALAVVEVIALMDEQVAERMDKYRKDATDLVASQPEFTITS